MCQFHGHARNRRQCHTAAQKLKWYDWSSVPRMEGLPCGKVLGCCELPACRARCDPPRQFNPKTVKARRNPVPEPHQTFFTLHNPASFFLSSEESRFNDSRHLPIRLPRYEDKELGSRGSDARNFVVGESPMAHSCDHFSGIRKPTSYQEAKSPVRAQSTSTFVPDKFIRLDTVVVPLPNQSWQNTGWSIHKHRRIKQIITLHGCRVYESHDRSHCSVVATLVLLVHQMATKSHPFTDDASKFTGVSSKSNPVGKRVLALAAV